MALITETPSIHLSDINEPGSNKWLYAMCHITLIIRPTLPSVFDMWVGTKITARKKISLTFSLFRQFLANPKSEKHGAHNSQIKQPWHYTLINRNGLISVIRWVKQVSKYKIISEICKNQTHKFRQSPNRWLFFLEFSNIFVFVRFRGLFPWIYPDLIRDNRYNSLSIGCWTMSNQPLVLRLF